MKLALATTLTAVSALPANSTDVSQSSDRLVKQTRRFEDFKRLFEAIYSEDELNKVKKSKREIPNSKKSYLRSESHFCG